MNVRPRGAGRSRPTRRVASAVVLLALSASCAESPDAVVTTETTRTAAMAGALAPVFVTDPVQDDADDPAIWIDADDPCGGLIIGTNKAPAPQGAVVVFDLEGRAVQTIAGLDRPNNVDVEYGWRVAGAERDIALVTERLASRVRVFEITGGDPPLVEIGGFDVLEGETGQRAEPMGIGTYRRPSDGAVFVIVSPKEGGPVDHLWQYRLDSDDAGGVAASLVRRFGHRGDGSPDSLEDGEVEAIVVDDELGYVFYADEDYGLRKWWANPDHAQAGIELAVFGRAGYEGDREGLAIYAGDGGAGYLVSVDQTPDASTLVLYPRSGSGSDPHDHEPVDSVLVAADTTDGVEATSSPLPGLPAGAVVAMDSERRAFAVFDWRSLVEPAAGDVPELDSCTSADG